MSSSVKLKNIEQTELSIEHTDGQPARSISTRDISYTVDTVADMEALIAVGQESKYEGHVCVVRDSNRGGTFVYNGTGTGDNQGTNFSGWVRQYSGAVNVKWFGAKTKDEDAIFDNAVVVNSIVSAFPLGVEIFAKAGIYKVFSQVVIPASFSLVGEGDRSTIFECDTSTGFNTDWFMKIAGGTNSRNFRLVGIGKLGLGLYIGNTDDNLGFSGNGMYENIIVTAFARAMKINSTYSMKYTNIVCEGNGSGCEMIAESGTGDNGYSTNSTFLNCNFRFNDDFGFVANSPLGNRNTRMISCSIEGNSGATSGYQSYFQFGEYYIDGMYFEDVNTIPAMRIQTARVEGSDWYFNGTGGLDLAGTTQNISLSEVNCVSVTDIINFTPSASTSFSIRDSKLNQDLPRGGRFMEIINTVETSQVTNNYVEHINIGSHIDSKEIESVRAYQSTITNTVPANGLVVLKSNVASSSAMNNCVAVANFQESYNNGILLQVHPATTGNNSYFTVVAYNMTASPIVLSGVTLNVMVTRFSSLKAV